MEFFRKHLRFASFITGMTVLLQMLMPAPVFSVTGHDSMPEYTGFTPYSTSNMVNLTNGSLTYNLPLMEVPGGYPINLSYNSSSVNPEAMASWVGLGWNLNPGTISVTNRGFADSFDAAKVKYYSKMPKNWTLTATLGAGMESFGGEKGLNLSVEGRVSFNNYRGITTGISGDVSALAGFASLSFDYSGGRFGFNPRIDPGALLMSLQRKSSGSDPKESETAKQHPCDEIDQAIHNISNSSASNKSNRVSSLKRYGASNGSGGPQIGFNMGGFGMSSSGSFSMSPLQPTAFPTTLTAYTGISRALKVEVGINGLPIPFDPEAKVGGTFVQQESDSLSVRTVYGYLNNEKALNQPEAMMDYYTENEKMFEKRDKYLAVPFPNNDVYVVSGEGISGTFRAHRNEFGHYRKNRIESRNHSTNLGTDVNIASIATSPPFLANLVYTMGGNLGKDNTRLSIGDWDDDIRGDANLYKFRPADDFPTSNENFYFRFTHDMSANEGLSIDESPGKARLEPKGLVARPVLSSMTNQVDDRNATARSSFIAYTYLDDFLKLSNGHRFVPKEKKLQVLSKEGEAEPYPYSYYKGISSGTSIAEFSITNADGMNYEYGLPVYVKNEKSLNYSVNVGGEDSNVTIKKGKIAEFTGSDLHKNAKMITGYTCDEPYVSAYLLTGITSPDYIDRENDGLTPDDFGTYTRFNYQRVAGGTEAWYVFRTPYNDASFDHGSLSSNKDDMASYSAGEKEVYYLNSISSKTHVAIFRTSDREDGGSAALNSNSTLDAFLKGSDGSQIIKAKKLNLIELYSLTDCNEVDGSKGIYEPKAGKLPIQVVHFEYDYSLCQNIPNNTKNDPDVSGFRNQGGKLTLKRVWFEYGGTLTHTISPYEFGYSYPTNSYPQAYSAFSNYGSQFQQQNPNYDILDMDRWGNYRNYSALQASHDSWLAPFFPYVQQNSSPGSFDPAAWMLKQIKLPGGGEIHVQYEEGDYQFVQDRPAMVMVPLSEWTSSDDAPNNKYYLDLSKVGITDTPDQALADALFRPMRVDGKRLFFNFIYNLITDDLPTPGNGTSEAIEGFARIAGYGVDSHGIYFVFRDPESSGIPGYTPLFYGQKFSNREIPCKVCKDFYNTQRRGLLTGNPTALSQGSDKSRIKAFAAMLKSAFAVSPCKKMAPKLSYVRLEAPMKKRGGGARVKRLLTYDRGINPSDNAPVLYGQEYRYETVEGGRVISSGVAANEPGTGRMENPLVEPIDKSEQSKWEAILYGRDMYGQTGPIGEYIMPGPSVTYSVVTVSSIYKGKTSTGSEVHEFYTSRNYPFKFASTTIAQEFDNPIGLSGGAYGRGVSYSRQAPFLAQGYTFYQNEMDGQPKRNAKYSAAGTGTAPIAEEIYEYYQPGELLKLMNENLAIELGGPGVEREVLGEMVQVKDITNGGSIEPDLSLGTAVLPIAPIPVLIPTIKKLGIYRNEKILRTHVTNKIISYPAILKRTINRADGVVQRSDFEVFDKNTGAPLVTRTFDDQRGAYLSQELRAYWNYWNLGNKSRNEGLVTGGEINYGIDQGRPYIQFKGIGNCGVSGKFAEGDLIQLSPNNCSPSSELLYHVDAIDAGKDRLYLFSSGMKASNCTPPSSITSVKILRSGFKNQLNANMGQLMTHRADGAPTFFSSNPTNQAPPSHPLIDELNSALDLAIRQGGNQSGNILLAGPFAGISIPTDPCIIPGDCGNGGLMLTNANLHYRIDNGNLFLMLESAKVSNAQGQQVHVISCIPRTDTISVFNSNGPWNPGPIDIHNNYNVRTIAPNALSPNPLGTPSGLNPSNGFPMVSSYFPLPNSNQVVNSGGGQSGGNARTMGSGNGCNFPNPKIQDHLNRGNTNKEFHLDYEGDATEIVEYCQGALNPYVSWKMKDLKNVKNVIVVRKIDNSGNRTLIRGRWYSDKNPGTYQEFMPIIVDDGYFPGPGLYEFEIIMFKGKVEFDGNWNYEIKKTGALRSLVVYKCVNACAPSINKILMNGNGYSFPHASTGENIASDDVSIFETKCLGNVPSIQLAAQLVGFSPYQYVWTVNGPNTNITSPNASIQFSPTTPGIYQIGLRITDRFGKSDEVASNLRIVNCNACVASIDGPADYCLNYSPNGITNLPTPKTFTRNNQSNCSDNNCSWEVWKGTSRLVSSQPASCTSSPNSFTYTFTAPGEYFIHVRSENLNNPLGQPRATNDNVKKIEIVDCRPARADFTIEMGPCPDRKVIVKANPLSDVPISSYEWDFGDGTLASGMYASHSYSGCGTRTITLRYQKQSRVRMMPSSISHTFAGNAARPCHEICNCESSFSLPNWDNFASGTFTTTVGKFKYDPLTHGIDFVSPDCPRTYPLDCWRVCNPVTAGVAKDTISNVISASATTFSGNWGYDLARYPKTPSPANGPLYQGNPFEDGTRGRWLPMEQYVYRAPITQRDPNPGNYGLKSFNAGTFVLEMFDWRNGLNNSDKWVKTNTTRQYTPNSEPEEDENILKIRSTAKYGYRNTLLTLAAQNAAKNTVAFEGFENLYGSTTPYWEDGIPFLTGSGTVDPTNAFTGKKAMRLKENHLFEAAWIVGQGEPVVVRLWAKRLSRGGLNAGDLQVLVANGSPTNLKEITEAGEWTMYEGIIPALPTGNSVSLQLRTTISDLLVDDLRVQPYTSEMVCYVYDDAQRLLAAFDDQHFPLLYQYNAQGQLVRKLKVTREGTKVISETQYNTKGENRY